MLFNEIYGSYYQITERLIAEAIKGQLDEKRLTEIVLSQGFGESMLTIPDAIKNEEWKVITKDFETPLQHMPKRPLTHLEKRWMKALLSDPRIRLFDVSDAGLEDVEPLYVQNTISYMDRYADGDPFEDPAYIGHFRLIMDGLRQKRWLRVRFTTRYGTPKCWKCAPLAMEYSPKDDKFRMITAMGRHKGSINIARIKSVELLEPLTEDIILDFQKKEKLVADLYDQRNAMERAMLHFSHFEKETIHVGGDQYELHLYYDQEDEAELLIRILQFGPFIKVREPESMVNLIKERLQMQKNLQKG